MDIQSIVNSFFFYPQARHPRKIIRIKKKAPVVNTTGAG